MAQLYVEAVLLDFDGFLPSGIISDGFCVPPGEIVKHFQETGDENMLRDAWFVPDVCIKPEAIWKGLGRPGHDDVLVYSGFPSGEFASDHGQDDLVRIDGKTFLVFIDNDLAVAKYRWCDCDSDGSGYPKHYKTRFGERVWPKD